MAYRPYSASRRFIRLGAAVTGACLAVLCGYIPAGAVVIARPVVANDPAYRGVDVQLLNDPQQATPEKTYLLPLKVNGLDKPVLTYCVELKVNVDYDDDMTEVDWSRYPDRTAQFNQNKTKINWVLHHSYPLLSLSQVSKEINKSTLTTAEAIGATQAAIWHYSDGVDLATQSPNLSGNVVALYRYLTDTTMNTGIDQPAPTLEVTAPNSMTPDSSGLIGPFVVDTTAVGTLDIGGNLPKGVTVTDVSGNPLTHVGNKAQLYVKVPAEISTGQAEFTLSGTTALIPGRLFIGPLDKSGEPIAQSLIVASDQNVLLSKPIQASWWHTTAGEFGSSGPNDQRSLAGILVIGGIVLALVIVGGGTAFFLRRRPNKS